MKSLTQQKFFDEIERIVSELYYNPQIKGSGDRKCSMINTQIKHVDYLVENNLIVKHKNTITGNCFGLELTVLGREIFEMYGGWYNFKKKVLDKEAKLVKANELRTKYWWLTPAIYISVLLVSILALLK